MRILLILFLSVSSLTFSQEKYGQIDLNEENFDEFSVFGDTLDSYKVYFTGENHMYATFNSELQIKFLKYLHQTQGVSHLIFEQSPAVGYIIDKVIIDGKMSHQQYLQDMFYTPFFEAVKELKDYNDTLAPENKIHVNGIDAERFPYFSIYALDAIVDTLDTRFEGGELFEQIKALASANYDDYRVGTYYDEPDFEFDFQFTQVYAWSSLKSIIDGANEMKDKLMPRLGADGPIFYAIIASLEVGREWYLAEKAGDVKSPIIRERFMCDEFERVYRLDPKGKFYGQFGRCHLQKDKGSRNCYDYYMNSVASRIAEIEPALENQVLVIPIFYTDNPRMDGTNVESLHLDEQFLAKGESFIIDLEYMGEYRPITGFYDDLPFIIICNEEADSHEETYFVWDIPLEEYHAGVYYGYHYFTKINKLNNALIAFGSSGFTNKFEAYTFAFDYIFMEQSGSRFSYTHIPAVTNNDGFELNGFLASMGGYYPFGNKWVMAAIGMDFGYGRMLLTEETSNLTPNLIQQNGKNLNIYRNDIFALDPNFEFRITLPIVSLNFKTGWAFDVSNKYWKLDGKMKDFTKTSFSSPYIQAGLSLNIKYR
ncbi:MAG: hypothetical protein IPO32_07830 [Crocinitomicaceae bacterium]|nr:hypothetical protein [Crocinitomicaceae bacterium]MBK9591403.1 hypothetical protein [Crocinitomicaceae bacterium]